MKKAKVKFGRPILMMRFNGSIRIIYPDGKVEFCMSSAEAFEEGCTTRETQKKAYRACVKYDGPRHARNFSAVLGYL
jgi:hypothetical protein